MPSPRGPRSSRHTLIFILLLALLTLIGLLGWQAQDAVRSHRATAENVLRDYAALAAGEFARRSGAQLSYYGVRLAMAPLDDKIWPTLPEAEEALAKRRGEFLPPEQQLVRGFFRFDGQTDDLYIGQPFTPSFFSPKLKQKLLARLAGVGNNTPGTLLLLDQNHGVVFRPTPDPNDGNRVEGFITHTQAFATRFEFALGRGPLMPVSIDGQPINNNGLWIQVEGPAGELVYQTGMPYYGIASGYGLEYGFEDLTVTITLKPEIAPRLIIGGLPRNRLPLLLGLLLLSAGLIAVTLFQYRRELDLARKQADSIASISHELRTPLAQIKMFAETLKLERVRNPEERERSLQIILAESDRLGHLIENVILFTRGVYKTVSINPCAMAGEPFLQELAEHFQPLAHSSGADLVLQIDQPLTVVADEEALRRMLLNYLDNALKYGPSGQTISLGLKADGERAVFWVEDQGEGIEADARGGIWARFERLPRHQGGAIAGTGIGLAIVAELAHAQNALVDVETGKSGGARFLISLPMAAADTSGPP